MKEYFEYMYDIISICIDHNFKQNIIYYMKNGFYIPFLYAFLLYTTNRFYVSTVIAIKLYPANHFYWFGELYSYRNIPTRYNYIKQFVRLTDTGHILNLLYLCDSSYLPLAHNIHFVITSGYWIGRTMGIKDQDNLSEKPNTQIIRWHETAWACASHGIPYLLCLRELFLSESCHSFDSHTLWISYQWIYIWVFTVYIPWRIYTGDIMYSVMDFNMDTTKLMTYLLVGNLLVILANSVGTLQTYFICYK